jgi:hypothetical protein
MNDPKLTAFAAPEGRVSAYGRPGATDMKATTLLFPRLVALYFKENAGHD